MDNIMKMIKSHSCLLNPWSMVLASLLVGLKPKLFVTLNNVDDFIDGFQLSVDQELAGNRLVPFLKEEGLEIIPPHSRGGNNFWVQLKGGQVSVEHNIPILKSVVEKHHRLFPLELRSTSGGENEERKPCLTKLDTTRDIGGFFFAGTNWKVKHNQLKKELSRFFGVDFVDNGNSFDTCFQFVGQQSVGHLFVRVKYYNKGLEMT